VLGDGVAPLAINYIPFREQKKPAKFAGFIPDHRLLNPAFGEDDFYTARLISFSSERKCSRMRTAWSRVTVGKFSRNSSRETPASRFSSNDETGTLVPVNTGVPLITSRSTVIGRSSLIVIIMAILA